MGNSIWLLLGSKRSFQRAVTLEILPRAGSSRATSSSHLFLSTGSCPHKEGIVSCLEGELHDYAFPFQVSHGYCHSWAANWYRSIWDELKIKPIYTFLLLTAVTQKPLLLFNPHSFTSDLLLQPAWLWVSKLSGHKLGLLLTIWIRSASFLSFLSKW